MVVGFITTCTLSAYHHYLSYEFESRSWGGELNTTLCDEVYQRQVCDFLRVLRFSSINKTDRHDIVALNTITRMKIVML